MYDNNIIPLRKADKFGVYLGDVTSDGEIQEGESVGIAYLKPGSKKFRLKLFVWPSVSYFVMPNDRDAIKYDVLSLEEYTTAEGVAKSIWHRIGYGNLVGSFIALRIQLISDPVFLCLFPEKNQTEEDMFAA